MLKRFLLTSTVVIVPVLAGCAYTTATRVLPGEDPRGFVYYECKPLLVVSGSTVSVTYVKNPSKAYAVQFGAFLAKNDTAITFDKDCGVTNVKSLLDSTDILKLFQTIADKVLPTAQKSVAGENGQATVQIFDIIFDDAGEIVSLRPLVNRRDLIRVPANPV
jgi:hypothetical protein